LAQCRSRLDIAAGLVSRHSRVLILAIPDVYDSAGSALEQNAIPLVRVIFAGWHWSVCI